MYEEEQTPVAGSTRPAVVDAGPVSIEELLQNVDPAPDEETERFVAEIYADRRAAAVISPAR